MSAAAVPFRLRLPATSANLGPGFDALGLAMALYLTIDAEVSSSFRLEATGRDAELCGRLKDNLIVDTYSSVLAGAGRDAPALFLRLQNEIPLGMGCGSSAAALLAGVSLANHFGELGWSDQRILEEASCREGHPDNVAACWKGGMTSSSMDGNSVITATCGENLNWKLMLALPPVSLATEKARAMLPATYTRADAVANIQNTALLVSAFALDQPELLRVAMGDRIHQPYRRQACPLLTALLPMVEEAGVYGVALSGAGPSVLVIYDHSSSSESVKAAAGRLAVGAGLAGVEFLETAIASGAMTAG